MGRITPVQKKAKLGSGKLTAARKFLIEEEARQNDGALSSPAEQDVQVTCKGAKRKSGRPRSDEPSTSKRQKKNSLPENESTVGDETVKLPLEDSLDGFTVLNREFVIRSLAQALPRDDIDAEVLADAIVLFCVATPDKKLWHMMLNKQTSSLQTYVNELGSKYAERYLALRGTKTSFKKAGRTIVAAINNSEMSKGLVPAFLMKLFGYLRTNNEEMEETLGGNVTKNGYSFLMTSKYSSLWNQNLQIDGPWDLMIDPKKERNLIRDDPKSVLLSAAIAEFQSSKTRSEKLKAITALRSQIRRELGASRKKTLDLEGYLATTDAEFDELMKVQEEEDFCYAVKIQIEQLLNPAEVDNFIKFINRYCPKPEDTICAADLTKHCRNQETAWLDKRFDKIQEEATVSKM